MAFGNLQELVDRAVAMVQNERAGIGLDRGTVQDEALATIAWLSRYVPRHVSGTLSGDGSSYQFLLTLLSTSDSTKAWVAGFSTIQHVEHPTGEQRPTLLDPGSYELWPSYGAATHLQFVDTAPASGSSNVRVAYTVPHTVSDTASTVPDDLEPGFEYGVAAALCRVYASRYGHSTQSAIDADSINYGSLSATWDSRAKDFTERAGRALGVDLGEAPAGGKGTVKAAGAYVDLDPETRFGGLVLRSRRQR